MATDHAIFSHGQVLRTTPELTSLDSNGRTLSLDIFKVHQRLHMTSLQRRGLGKKDLTLKPVLEFDHQLSHISVKRESSTFIGAHVKVLGLQGPLGNRNLVTKDTCHRRDATSQTPEVIPADRRAKRGYIKRIRKAAKMLIVGCHEFDTPVLHYTNGRKCSQIDLTCASAPLHTETSLTLDFELVTQQQRPRVHDQVHSTARLTHPPRANTGRVGLEDYWK
ncbi:hypothetical protein TNCV_129441 [Trichonephila clavipes]|nr:hypothetical protein TNCV_129441 [Trichonephila clavipes]